MYSLMVFLGEVEGEGPDTALLALKKRFDRNACTQIPPSPPPPPPPPALARDAATNPPPVRSKYATQDKKANKPNKPAAKGKGKAKEGSTGPPHKTSPPPEVPTIQGRTVVLHGAPTKFRAGEMRRWIEKDNRGRAPILGICWLVQEHRREGKLASSLVIYRKEKVDTTTGFAWEGESSALQNTTGAGEGYYF